MENLDIPENALVEFLQGNTLSVSPDLVQQFWTNEESMEDEHEIHQFIQFAKERYRCILVLTHALDREIIEGDYLKRILIFQRAIFILKRSVVTLEEIATQKKVAYLSVSELLSEVEGLGSDEIKNLQKKAVDHLLEESRSDQTWRANSFQQPQKPERKSLTTAVAPITTRFSRDSISVEPPPSSSPDLSSELGDYDLTESIPIHELNRSNSSSWLVPSLILVCIAIIGGVFLLPNPSPAKKDFQKIKDFYQKKDFVEVEKLSERFLKKYPGNDHGDVIKEYLDEINWTKIDILYRQEKLTEAYSLIQSLEAEGVITLHADRLMVKESIQKELDRVSQVQAVTQYLQDFEQLLADEKLVAARGKLSQMSPLAKLFPKDVTIEKLESRLEQLQQDLEKSRYHFLTADKIATPPTLESPKRTDVARIPLYGQGKIYQNTATENQYFFPIIKGYLYAVQANDGQIAWGKYLGNASTYPPIFLAGMRPHHNMKYVDKILIASTQNNSLELISANTGKASWSRTLPSLIATSPSVFGNNIYISCLDGYCYNLDLKTGEFRGAFYIDDIPKYSPLYDKKTQVLIIPGEQAVWGYYLPDKRFLYKLERTYLVAQPIVIASHLFLFEQSDDDTLISLYSVKEGTPKYLTQTKLPGQMNSPASLAGGILAVATNQKLGIFGINPHNPRESMFSLGTPINLSGNSFMLFTNLMRHLIVAGKRLDLYQINQFSADKENLKQISHYDIPTEQSSTVTSIQRSGSCYFWLQERKGSLYGHCLELKEGKMLTLWQQNYAPSANSYAFKTNDQRVFWTTEKGQLHEMYQSNQDIALRLFSESATAMDFPPVYLEQSNEILVYSDRLRIVDAVTGWEKNWQPKISIKGNIHRTLLHGDNLFLGSDGGVYAISKTSGDKSYLEFSEFKGQPYRSEIVLVDKTLFIGCDNGTLYELTLAETPERFLKKTWEFETGGAITGNLVQKNNLLIFGSADNYVYAIDIQKKKLEWKFFASGTKKATISVSNSHVYIGSENRKMYALSVDNGSLLWEKQFRGKITTQPLILDDFLYQGSLAGDLQKIHRKTGKTHDKVICGGSILTSPTLFHDKIFWGTTDGFIYCWEQK